MLHGRSRHEVIFAVAADPYGYGFTGLNLGLLILRLAVGFTIMAYGFTHIWGRERIDRTATWLESRGLEPGPLQARLIGSVELLSGAGLVLGLLNPLAAAGVVGVCGVNYAITGSHRTLFSDRTLFAQVDQAGHDYMLTIAVVAMALGATGPGRWSLDQALGNELYGMLGFVVTVVVGLGSILVTLVGFWQPAKARRLSRERRPK